MTLNLDEYNPEMVWYSVADEKDRKNETSCDSLTTDKEEQIEEEILINDDFINENNTILRNSLIINLSKENKELKEKIIIENENRGLELISAILYSKTNLPIKNGRNYSDKKAIFGLLATMFAIY